MTKKQIKNYIMRNSNIDFNYNGKRFGIERTSNKGSRIYFWEWYNETTLDNYYTTYDEFEKNAKIDGIPVVEILSNIDDADVFWGIYD